MARSNWHQRHTHAKPSKVYPEKLGDMLFQDRQSMQKDLCHTPKISRRFASEWRSGPWCCAPYENRTGCPPVLIPLFLGISFQGIWHHRRSQEGAGGLGMGLQLNLGAHSLIKNPETDWKTFFFVFTYVIYGLSPPYPNKNPRFAYLWHILFLASTSCITPKRVTSWQGLSPRHCSKATQLLSKKWYCEGEPLTTLCLILPELDYNFRPTTPETNALPPGMWKHKL